MKRRLLGAGMAALMMMASMVMPVIADDDGQQVTDLSPSADTDVEAKISETAGNVAYIVKVPLKINFGDLEVKDPGLPAEDRYAHQKFNVECVSMNGIDAVNVSVMDITAKTGEQNQNFIMTNQTNTSCTFVPNYDIALVLSNGTLDQIETTGSMPAMGFQFAVLTAVGQKVEAFAGVDQGQLDEYKSDISQIAGTYAGTLVFTTAGITNSQPQP
jgi:hypothetical protein